MTREGYAFEVIRPDGDEEEGNDIPVSELVVKNAFHKAQTVFSSLEDSSGAAVIGADTLVSLGGKALGKPKDSEEAKTMLSLLSGNTHEVMTGYAIVARGKRISGCAVTRVGFRKLSDSEINEYVATGEPLDKAGAYGIQEGASAFVAHIEGELSNVIGLPASDIRAALKQLSDE